MTHEIPLSGYSSTVKRIELYPEQSVGTDYLHIQPDAEWSAMQTITVSFYRRSVVERRVLNRITYEVEVPASVAAEATSISDIGVIVIEGVTTDSRKYTVDVAFTVPGHSDTPGSQPVPVPEDIDQLILLAGQAQLVAFGVRDNIITVSNTQPTSEFNQMWVEPDIAENEIPDMGDIQEVVGQIMNLRTYIDGEIDYVISLIEAAYEGEISLPSAEGKGF